MNGGHNILCIVYAPLEKNYFSRPRNCCFCVAVEFIYTVIENPLQNVSFEFFSHYFFVFIFFRNIFVNIFEFLRQNWAINVARFAHAML